MTGFQSSSAPSTLVVMGVCGVGKTSVARALAETLPAQYVEADDFHSVENVEAMRAGTPLTDALRQPWLKAITAEINARHKAQPGGQVVLSCSALKRAYRDILRGSEGDIGFIHLTGERDLIAARLSSRADHFLAPTLLDSQLLTLEPLEKDEQFIDIDVSRPLPEVVEAIIAQLV